MSESSNQNVKKKARKGVAVPSRYKAAAEAFSSSSGSRDSTQAKDRNETVFESTASWRPNDTVRAKKITSTPYVQGTCAFPAIDASAITDASGFLCVPKKKNTLASPVKRHITKKKEPTSKLCSGTNERPVDKEPSKRSLSDMQTEIDILYAQYLQAKFLEFKAGEALVERFKCAFKKIHQAWHLIQVLMGKCKNQEQNLNFLSCYIKLHVHLCKQEQILNAPLEFLPVFKEQYQSIAESMDLLNNKLETKNIILPDSDCKENFITLITSINNFLVKALNCIHDCDKLILAASESEGISEQLKLISVEVDKALLLVSQANDLLLSETSLQLSSNVT